MSHDAAGELQWSDGRQTVTREPQASLARRMLASAIGLLPIESQL